MTSGEYFNRSFVERDGWDKLVSFYVLIELPDVSFVVIQGRWTVDLINRWLKGNLLRPNLFRGVKKMVKIGNVHLFISDNSRWL